MYFVDTNTCIYFMNGKYSSVKETFLSISPKEIKIPAVVKAELLLGAYKSQTREQTVKKVKNFLKPFEIISFTDDMTEEYAAIRAELELSGKTVDLFGNLMLQVVKATNKRYPKRELSALVSIS